MNDKEIILAVKQNRRLGQKVLFEYYYPKMYSVALRYLGNLDDTEDALSESFIRVFRFLKQFTYEGEGSLEKWMVTITVREALRILKKRTKFVFINEETHAPLTYSNDIEDNISVGYLLHEIEKLPPGYKSVLFMYCVEGYSHKEIADMLDISVSTSKSQLHKARHFLQTRIKKEQLYEFRKIR